MSERGKATFLVLNDCDFGTDGRTDYGEIIGPLMVVESSLAAVEGEREREGHTFNAGGGDGRSDGAKKG